MSLKVTKKVNEGIREGVGKARIAFGDQKPFREKVSGLPKAFVILI